MIIVNGKEDNRVNIDTAFFFGKGVFETILVKEKPIFLEKHIERLNSGARELGIKRKVTLKEVYKVLNELNINNIALKVVLTDYNVVITTREIPYDISQYKEGFKIIVSKVRRNSTSRLTYIKSINYIENLIEKENANERGFNEVIFLNENDKITEGSCSNLFFVKGKEIFTPCKKQGLLDGIMRKWIVHNYSVHEGEYTLADIYKADGVFLTNSLMGIMKVVYIENSNENSYSMVYEANELVEQIQRDYNLLILNRACKNNM